MCCEKKTIPIMGAGAGVAVRQGDERSKNYTLFTLFKNCAPFTN